MKKTIIYILLLSNTTFAQNVTIDTDTIIIGEQIKLTISNNLSDAKFWPSYKPIFEGLEIVDSSKIDTTDEVIRQEIILTAWDSGNYYIPSIQLSEKHKTEEILINVKPVTTKEAELRDIKGPIKEPIGWSDIWPWLIGSLAMLIAIYLIKKYLLTKKSKKKRIKPKIVIPPDITALKELIKLEKAKVWQEGNIKEYHSKLSEIIRRYIEEKYKFIALELTTEEILNELKSKLASKESKDLRTLLERADLAKFAKSKPIASENKESMILAKKFVEQTKGSRKDG